MTDALSISFTLNMHKGNKISVQGFPLPSVGVSVQSSNPKVCEAALANEVISVNAIATGEAVLTASVLGIAVPGQVTVKVW